MSSKNGALYSELLVAAVLLLLFAGCAIIHSSEEIESDSEDVKTRISETQNFGREDSSSPLGVWAQVRLSKWQNTEAMLERKLRGIDCILRISYLIDGSKYTPPSDKIRQLSGLAKDIDSLKPEENNATDEAGSLQG